MTRWFEDVVIGEVVPLGAHIFTQDAIIAFGRAYDPQYFHVDPEAAAAGPFDGLVASGWHTVSAGQRLMVDALVAEAERLRALGKEPGVTGPSPGVDQVEFRAPVRPGDTISYSLAITGKRISKSIPGWGLLFNTIEGINQHGQSVYFAKIVGFSKRRDISARA